MATDSFQGMIDKAFQDLTNKAFGLGNYNGACPTCNDGQLVIIDSQDTYVIIECMGCGKLVGVQVPAGANITNKEIIKGVIFAR